MEESIDWERSHNCKLCKENCRLSGEVGRLQFQINDMRVSRPAAGVDNYSSDHNLSLFPSSDDDGSNWNLTGMPPSMMASSSWIFS